MRCMSSNLQKNLGLSHKYLLCLKSKCSHYEWTLISDCVPNANQSPSQVNDYIYLAERHPEFKISFKLVHWCRLVWLDFANTKAFMACFACFAQFSKFIFDFVDVPCCGHFCEFVSFTVEISSQFLDFVRLFKKLWFNFCFFPANALICSWSK